MIKLNAGQGFSPANKTNHPVGQGFSPADNKTVYKKRIRLKNFNYIGTYSYFATLCTSGKKNLFISDEVIQPLICALKITAKQFGFKIWAYCFMPNHLHLLAEGCDQTSDFTKFMSRYKQQTGFEYKHIFEGRLWQINYYEHVLRKDEDVMNTALYIFGNPVRKGLVDDHKKYPYLGSFEFDINE
jgi:putative transposase